MIRSFKLILPSLLLIGCNSATKPEPIKTPAVTSAPIPAPATASVGSGLHTTASGLQYQVLKRGNGTMSPRATDTVKVHYHGTLTNGSVFDSSVQRGEPISFPLNGVIPGWTEGVQLMKVGDKFRFVIPYDLAYGANGSPPKIPPFSTLIFEVELLGIN